MLISAQGMETALDVLLLSPHLCPPENADYGSRTNGFVLSRIHRFGGKLWQLRSVRVRGGDWHVLPFVVNTGGSTWDTPIIGEPAARRLGLRRDGADVLDQVHDTVLEIPNLVGRIRRPLALEWDCSRTLGDAFYDVRMNLVGHELAQAIDRADAFATSIDNGELSEDLAVRWLVRDFGALGATPESAMREIRALLDAPPVGDHTWTNQSLALAPSARSVSRPFWERSGSKESIRHHGSSSHPTEG